MKGKMLEIIQKAQKIQKDMQKIQKELSLIVVEGQSAQGLVKVQITCKNKVKKIFINNSLLNEDKDMLEDLIMIAVNEALKKAKIKSKEKIKNVTVGLPENFLDLINFMN